MKPGKFIAIEGPDGSGKGTQKDLLAKKLAGEGHRVFEVSFPQYKTSIFGKHIGKMLAGEYGPMENIHPMLASIVYANDRWKAAPAIAMARRKGHIVISDRYTNSNKAHQSARLPVEQREEFLKDLEELEYSYLGFAIPKPDLNIFLDVPIEITQELILEKAEREYLNGAKKDLLEANIEHQMEAAKMYKYLAETTPDIVRIDCVDSDGLLLEKEIIADKVYEKVSILLDGENIEGRIRGERE